LAKGGLGLCVPWGAAGSLELDADLPEEGIALEPILASRVGPARPAASPIAFRLRYAASLSASRGRPRSRRMGRRWSRGIAPRPEAGDTSRDDD
jgi:hypothetical protein